GAVTAITMKTRPPTPSALRRSRGVCAPGVEFELVIGGDHPSCCRTIAVVETVRSSMVVVCDTACDDHYASPVQGPGVSTMRTQRSTGAGSTASAVAEMRQRRRL